MASTINSDNGVVSGSSGLKSTADTSGVLALQSNGSTALSIGTDLNVTLTNPLPVASGGTNSTATPTAGGVGYGTGTAHAYTSAGTSGQVLTSSGSGAPTWATANTGNFGTDITFTDYTLTTSTALTATPTTVLMQSVSLDGTSELMILHGSSSAHAVVWNSSTNTFGTPVLVRTATLNSRQNIALAKVSATSVLVCSLASTTTALETVVLTVSGSTITVNTPVATTLAANSILFNANTRLVTVGSSFVLNYYNTTGTTPKFRAITVSGTTPSIGSELAYAGPVTTNAHHSYAYSSSILLYMGTDATNGFYAYPITVSGTTLTGGTAATLTTLNSSSVCTGVLSTGRVAMIYLSNTGFCVGTLVSVTGSVAAITAAATTLTTSTFAPKMQVFSNQAFILGGTSNSDQISVLTDTAGVPTVGTPLTNPVTGNLVGYLSTGKVFYSGISGDSSYYQYGISAGAPVLEKSFQNVTSTTAVTTQVAGTAGYSFPLSGPPQSGSGSQILLRTSAGKTAVGSSGTQPFAASIDGTYLAKLQQSANPFTTFNDAIDTAIGWGLPSTTSGTATAITIRKVTLA